MLFLCLALLPTFAVGQSNPARPAINNIVGSQLDSLAERIALFMDQNDFNRDGFVTAIDFYVDELRYQRDNDFCCISRDEWIDHVTSLNGFTEEFALWRYNFFVPPPGNCMSGAGFEQQLGVGFRLPNQVFIDNQLFAHASFCSNASDLFTTNQDCQQLFNWALNPTNGQCIGQTSASLAVDLQTACAGGMNTNCACITAVNAFGPVCNNVNTAGVTIPTTVDDNNLPTLAQNCALFNSFMSTRS